MQINLTGFLNGKNARIFMGELWKLLDSAQNNDSGIPQEMIDKKKEEIKNRRVSPNYINSWQLFLYKFRLKLYINKHIFLNSINELQEAEDRVSRVNETLKGFADADNDDRRQRSDRGGFGRGRSRSRSRSRSRDRGRRGRSRSRER